MLACVLRYTCDSQYGRMWGAHGVRERISVFVVICEGHMGIVSLKNYFLRAQTGSARPRPSL